MIDFSNLNIDKSIKKVSISNALDMLFTPFDSEGVAQKTYEKYYDNPESEYYHMTAEQIREAWSAKGVESCKYGSLLDDYIGATLTGTENDLRLFKLDKLSSISNSFLFKFRIKLSNFKFSNFLFFLSASNI